jgi:hypothetical protein
VLDARGELRELRDERLEDTRERLDELALDLLLGLRGASLGSLAKTFEEFSGRFSARVSLRPRDGG